MTKSERRAVRKGYDTVAGRYLAARPVDGADVVLLDDLVARLGPGERVLDAGAGAGVPVTARLVAAGVRPVALDFSAVQVALGQDLVPAAAYVQGDMAALPFPAGSFAAVVSFYAIIHLPRLEHAVAFSEIRRVLRPGGWALLCLGARDLPADYDPESWLGVPMFWSHFDRATNLALLVRAGFEIAWDRDIADPMEHGAHLFVLARRDRATL